MATTRPSPRPSGFTLVEMAIVLLILTLLAGSLTAGLAAHMARRAEAATDAALDEARDALLGYVVRKGYFPCPAKSATDGSEDRKDPEDPHKCRKNVGLLPWATLGIPGLDGWSHRLRYAVASEYVWDIRHTAVGEKANLADGDIHIKTRNIDGTELFLTTDGGRTPVVILSHGANGLGATDHEGNALAPPAAGSDEARNAGPDGRLFSARPVSENPGAPGGAFDDRVSWLSPNLIAHRLISAGRLP